ncbi:MAG: CPBP family intramembrane glutamic endopeptidase [Sedimentibacter sp.]|uniref:CPBP family intramembrane glutamic endopeptidase n=1 Tax=Sedimentibacter sp. TaxID=1960295 RepID=UPI0029821C14|nr:CPBP family intramembrane glutamic endopeptidase [Sedimentibacter sp.]MDW5299430.1 CPBP family intramembrane glutamic endopeptidase [Sedimentibacter sp.]
MKNNERIIYGIIITIVVFVIATFAGSKLHLNIDFFPYSFVTHSLMLILSIVLIYGLRKYVNYKIALPQFIKTLKPILFGLLATIIVNISMTVITKTLGGKVEAHAALTKMSPLQIFVFVFIYASIAEEILFRGFLMNILKPLKAKGINIFNRNISVPVLISAVAFGLGHLILITTGAGGLFLLRIVVFTTTLGLIAGYYQEKYENNAFAIIVHMAGNSMGVLGALLMNLNA